MAVYKIFAEKDTTLYSDYQTLNTGLDPILEMTKNNSLLYEAQSSAARSLIKFSDTDMSDVITNYIRTASFSSSLKIYLADATGLPSDFTVQVFAISGSWDMGTGKFGDSPIPTDGASWKFMGPSGSSAWRTSSFSPGVTASFTPPNKGGGTWYTGYEFLQSFGVYVNKDINVDVSPAVRAMLSSSISNQGFILKLSGSLEFDPNYVFKLCYFGRDTNTIYPPVLEFKWDDSRYLISGSNITGVSSQDIRVSLANNKGEFNQYEVHRFRLNVRDQFPVRTYATSSIYNTQKYIPSSSYYSIKDVKGDVTVVDFDNNFTKISADLQGNYFDVYMYGLEPERYYKILIKTIISGSTLIFDDQYFFKVTE
jgi:hypothetical protein